MLFFHDRIIIPTSLRKEILTLLHKSHFGIQKTKERAKELVFWPNINNQIEQMINSCDICQKYMRANCKEDIIFHEIPPFRFMKIGLDIMEFSSKCYLVIGDYFSKWIEIMPIKTKSMNEIISLLKNLFSTHGIPNEIVCDNSPFNAYSFKKFSLQYNFNITYSSPYYPKSNGFAERCVGIAKSLMKKAIESNTDLTLVLLEFRNTPIPSLRASPAQILFSRRCRTLLPIHENSLQPQIVDKISDKIKQNQEKIKTYYNKSSINRKDFIVGDHVMFRKPDKIWYPAKLVETCPQPRSYVLEDSVGKKYRRNKSMINPNNSDRTIAVEHFKTEPASHASGNNNCSESLESHLQLRSGRTVIRKNK